VPEDKIGKAHPFSTEKLGIVLAVFRYSGFDMALDIVRRIFETGGRGHSCGIYSFNDDHINRLALMAPVSRIMVRQIQSRANAGTFTNGMPMTSSMGCGIWGGNITNENISLKHYMNVTWVSRPIPRTSRPRKSCSVSSTTARRSTAPSPHGKTARLLAVGVMLTALSVGSCTKGPAPAARPEDTPLTTPTFSADVAPILTGHCATCHRPGQGAPFNLLTYADAQPRAAQIRKVTSNHVMPPWLPETNNPPFVGERRLSPDQIATLRRWAETGAAAGADLPPPAAAASEAWAWGSRISCCARRRRLVCRRVRAMSSAIW
jgi:mono/diheme cytochrome c family protein